MYKYKSKCRWNMLLHVDEEVVEIRPGELFKSKKEIKSRYLDLIENNSIKIKKKGRITKKSFKTQLSTEDINASSSTES